MNRTEIAEALTRAGFLSPDDEAKALVQASIQGVGSVDQLLARRIRGEPLAWVTGSVFFCGIWMKVHPGVFVPRPHTEMLARRAAELLPDIGCAVDLCTGCGAVATVLRTAHPEATVLATEIDPVAVTCAEANGVSVVSGDLDEPLPPSIRGSVDVVTAVVPYVPTQELHLLPADVLAHEPRRAIDGGPGGITLLRRAAEAAARLLRPSGTCLLELGGDQADEMTATLNGIGFSDIRVHRDGDGQARAIEATRL